MKVTLNPIHHRDEYGAMLEKELVAYFDETIYAPLRTLLPATMRTNTIEDWGWFPRGWGSLGIPRSEMPQIRAEQRDYFLISIRLANVETEARWVKAKDLQPTQSEFSRTKVQKAKEHVGPDRPLFVSADFHILDGHHQWVAQMEQDENRMIQVLRIDMETRALVDWAIKHQPKSRANALPKKEHSAIWDALLAGAIWYASGVFLGKFDAAISRELRAIGARKIVAGFALPFAEIPIVLRGVIGFSTLRGIAAHRAILAMLDQIQEHITEAPTGLDVSDTVDKTVGDLQDQLVRTVSEVKGLPTPPPVPEAFVEQAKEKLSRETIREIKNFSLEQLQTLRAKVQQNLSGGARIDRLAKVIEAEFGVAKRKAHIIAEAETSQLTADFRRTRYESLGATQYLWSTSHDEKVRPTHGESNNHRALDGRTFAWSSPPVVDSATGRRRHPGEDYGPCRCVARPVFNL